MGLTDPFQPIRGKALRSYRGKQTEAEPKVLEKRFWKRVNEIMVSRKPLNVVLEKYLLYTNRLSSMLTQEEITECYSEFFKTHMKGFYSTTLEYTSFQAQQIPYYKAIMEDNKMAFMSILVGSAAFMRYFNGLFVAYDLVNTRNNQSGGYIMCMAMRKIITMMENLQAENPYTLIHLIEKKMD